eukprot:g570.t1
MKFGETLAKNALEGWKYIDYERLKKMINDFTQNGKEEKHPRWSAVFYSTLLSEINAVNSFFLGMETMLKDNAKYFTKKDGTQKPKSDSKAQTQLCRMMTDLCKYAVLNYLAVLKIAKKHDKHARKKLSGEVKTALFTTDFFLSLTNSDLFITMNELMKSVGTESVQVGRPCPICKEPMNIGSANLPCGHSFCWSCLAEATWQKQKQCPACRKDEKILAPVDLEITTILGSLSQHYFPFELERDLDVSRKVSPVAMAAKKNVLETSGFVFSQRSQQNDDKEAPAGTTSAEKRISSSSLTASASYRTVNLPYKSLTSATAVAASEKHAAKLKTESNKSTSSSKGICSSRAAAAADRRAFAKRRRPFGSIRCSKCNKFGLEGECCGQKYHVVIRVRRVPPHVRSAVLKKRYDTFKAAEKIRQKIEEMYPKGKREKRSRQKVSSAVERAFEDGITILPDIDMADPSDILDEDWSNIGEDGRSSQHSLGGELLHQKSRKRRRKLCANSSLEGTHNDTIQRVHPAGENVLPGTYSLQNLYQRIMLAEARAHAAINQATTAQTYTRSLETRLGSAERQIKILRNLVAKNLPRPRTNSLEFDNPSRSTTGLSPIKAPHAFPSPTKPSMMPAMHQDEMASLFNLIGDANDFDPTAEPSMSLDHRDELIALGIF